MTNNKQRTDHNDAQFFFWLFMALAILALAFWVVTGRTELRVLGGICIVFGIVGASLLYSPGGPQ